MGEDRILRLYEIDVVPGRRSLMLTPPVGDFQPESPAVVDLAVSALLANREDELKGKILAFFEQSFSARPHWVDRARATEP